MMQLFQLLKVKFGLFVILVSLCSGCASNRVGASDMLSYKTNCSTKEESLAYLKSVQPDRLDEVWAGLQIIFMGPFTPDFERKKEIANGSARYWVRGVREDYMSRCGA